MLDQVKALTFDVFGTVVDWRGSITREGEALARTKNIHGVDWAKFAEARRAGLPWDVILGAEIARAYKPQPEAYLRSAEFLGLRPDECMMVAAHNSDHEAANTLGFHNAFVPRPTEYGPGQAKDVTPSRAWDVVAKDFGELA